MSDRRHRCAKAGPRGSAELEGFHHSLGPVAEPRVDDRRKADITRPGLPCPAPWWWGRRCAATCDARRLPVPPTTAATTRPAMPMTCPVMCWTAAWPNWVTGWRKCISSIMAIRSCTATRPAWWPTSASAARPPAPSPAPTASHWQAPARPANWRRQSLPGRPDRDKAGRHHRLRNGPPSPGQAERIVNAAAHPQRWTAGPRGIGAVQGVLKATLFGNHAKTSRPKRIPAVILTQKTIRQARAGSDDAGSGC